MKMDDDGFIASELATRARNPFREYVADKLKNSGVTSSIKSNKPSKGQDLKLTEK